MLGQECGFLRFLVADAKSVGKAALTAPQQWACESRGSSPVPGPCHGQGHVFNASLFTCLNEPTLPYTFPSKIQSSEPLYCKVVKVVFRCLCILLSLFKKKHSSDEYGICKAVTGAPSV